MHARGCSTLYYDQKYPTKYELLCISVALLVICTFEYNVGVVVVVYFTLNAIYFGRLLLCCRWYGCRFVRYFCSMATLNLQYNCMFFFCIQVSLSRRFSIVSFRFVFSFFFLSQLVTHLFASFRSNNIALHLWHAIPKLTIPILYFYISLLPLIFMLVCSIKTVFLPLFFMICLNVDQVIK